MLTVHAAVTESCQQWRRPLASLNADYPMYQRHLGWTFGYFTEASSTKLEELVWRQDEGKWGCADAAYEFPSMRPGEPPSICQGSGFIQGKKVRK